MGEYFKALNFTRYEYIDPFDFPGNWSIKYGWWTYPEHPAVQLMAARWSPEDSVSCIGDEGTEVGLSGVTSTSLGVPRAHVRGMYEQVDGHPLWTRVPPP